MTNELTTLPLPRLSIERYKGLEGLEFEDFGQINLIVGANNCGKTNVLNYVYIRLFEDCSESFSGRAFRLPSSSVQEFDFGRFQIDSSEASSILELLKIADPAITDFTKRLCVHRKGSGTLLVHQLGTGINRLLQIAIGIARAENGVFLIDDAETGLRPAIMCEAFAWIVQWAKKHNVQMFLTTHSLDLVDALISATGGWDDPESDDEDDIPEGDLDLVLFRLEPRDEETRVVRHGRDRLRRLRGDLGVDVLL